MLKSWLQDELGLGDVALVPASGDASFRRYFRVQTGERSYIAVDAPPEREDSRPFVDIAHRFANLGLNVPEILEADLQRGLLLVTDLGTRDYLSALDGNTADRLYGDALGALLVIQACGPCADELPPYDRELLLREMRLFPDWFLSRHLSLALSSAETQLLADAFQRLADAALSQPQVCVHRDFHSRNLLVTERRNPGILDFQDAVIGPVTYDLVSLLRDAYIAWPREQVESWALGYHDLALQSGVLRDTDSPEDQARFLRWFDWMGVQRQLKVAGIFARLYHRDAKAGYLADIPRTVGYLREVTGRYDELADLHEFVETRVIPAMEAERAGRRG
ncbi:MAG: phosphotransferase [Gammaproteobacteria bacterium]